MDFREISEISALLGSESLGSVVVQGEDGVYAVYFYFIRAGKTAVVALAMSSKNKTRANAGCLKKFTTIDTAINLLRRLSYSEDICVRAGRFDSGIK